MNRGNTASEPNTLSGKAFDNIVYESHKYFIEKDCVAHRKSCFSASTVQLNRYSNVCILKSIKMFILYYLRTSYKGINLMRK